METITLGYKEFEERFRDMYDPDDFESERESYSIDLESGLCSYVVRVIPAEYVHSPLESFSLRVSATGLRSINLSSSNYAEWKFFEDHPLLWDYEDIGDIICNSSVTDTQWLDIIERTSGSLFDPRFTHSDSWGQEVRLNSDFRKWSPSGSFFLGRFPLTVFTALTKAMDELGISYTSIHPPVAKELPRLFQAYGGDYVIADDFTVEAPESIFQSKQS